MGVGVAAALMEIGVSGCHSKTSCAARVIDVAGIGGSVEDSRERAWSRLPVGFQFSDQIWRHVRQWYIVTFQNWQDQS